MAQNSLVLLNEVLTVTSPRIVSGAELLRLKPATLLKKVEETFPSRVEASFYLALGPELKHRPKTFAAVMREFTANDEIKAADFVPVRDGAKLKVQSLLDDMEPALSLMLRLPNDYDNLRLSARTCARLVLAYGDMTDDFVCSVMDNIPEVAEKLGYAGKKPWRRRSGDDSFDFFPTGKVSKHAFGFWSYVIYPYCVARGIPHPAEFLDIFEDDCLRDHALSEIDNYREERGGRS